MSEYDLRKKLAEQERMRREYVPPTPVQALRWWDYFFHKFPLFAREMAEEAEKSKK